MDIITANEEPQVLRARDTKSRGLILVGASAFVIVALTYIPFVFVLANSVKTEAQYAQHPMAIMFTLHLPTTRRRGTV